MDCIRKFELHLLSEDAIADSTELSGCRAIGARGSPHHETGESAGPMARKPGWTTWESLRRVLEWLCWEGLWSFLDSWDVLGMCTMASKWNVAGKNGPYGEFFFFIKKRNRMLMLIFVILSTRRALKSLEKMVDFGIVPHRDPIWSCAWTKRKRLFGCL